MALLELEEINGTPVFISPTELDIFSRVYGAIFDRDRLRWLFPAYPPFGLTVISDLRKLAPNLQLSASAKQQLEILEDTPRRIQDRILPQGLTFVTKPFDHQIEGLAHLYHNPRFALLWDAGCGKTKVVIDLKRALPGKRMLVFGPRMIVSTWIREMAVHGPELHAVAIKGSPEQKLAIIRDYKSYDVLVASYGTARNFGLPRLHRSALKAIRTHIKAGVHLSHDGLLRMTRGLRQLSDVERQEAFVEEWAKGMTIAELMRQTATEAATQPQWLEDIDYQIIVADESHCIKEASSQQTKAVLGLSRKAARRYLMSGTPTLGDPRHLYPQMKFLSPAVIPEDWMQFSDMFLTRAPYCKRIVTGFKNLDVLNARVQRVSIRKRKDECLDLPPRQIIDVPFTLSDTQRKLYNTLIGDMAADLNTWFQNTTSAQLELQNAAVLLNKLTQVTSGFLMDGGAKTLICNGCEHLQTCVTEQIHPYTNKCAIAPKAPPQSVNFFKENPKLDLLEELLDGILEEPSHKVIIWGIFHAELDTIQAMLEKRKLGFVRVDGNNSGTAQTCIDAFNNDPLCRIYLGQVATGVGITLNAAQYMVYYSLDWSLATYLQSIDRNYRLGQTLKTMVYRLLGEGTVDGYKVKALDTKKTVSDLLVNKLACALCPRQFDCLKSGLELFDAGCVHKRTMTRPIARAKVIE